MNDLEEQLRSWTPRAPSPKVKAALFGRAEPSATRVARAGFIRQVYCCLAPALGCALLAFVTVNQRGPLERPTDNSILATLSMARMQGAVADVPVHFDMSDTAWIKTSFGWTNAGHSHSSMPAPLLWRTNSLMQ